MAFADNLKSIRSHHKWTQEEASNKMDIKKHNLAAWEEGRAVPSLNILKKLIEVYKIGPKRTHEFLFGTLSTKDNEKNPD